LKRASKHDSTWVPGFQQIQVGLGALSTLVLDLLFDFLVFENDEFVGFVSIAVKIGKNLEGFGFPIM
jgi:hypothetical protein